MEQHILGRTGVSVSKLCLGAMMFGAWGNPDHDESIRIIHAALDAGINFVDTADVYARGRVRGDRRQGARGAAATTSSWPPSSTGRWATTPTTRAARAAGSSATSRTRCAASAPTGSTSTRSTARAPTPTSRRRSAPSPTSCTRARSATSAPRPSPPARSSRRSGSARDAATAALRHRAAGLLDPRPRDRGRHPARPAQRHGMGVLSYSPLTGGWLSGRWRKDAGQQSSSRAEPAAGALRPLPARQPAQARRRRAARPARRRGRHHADPARDRLRPQPPRDHRRRSSARAPWSSSRASSPPPTSCSTRRCSTGSTRSSPPGTTINPVDNSFDNPALRADGATPLRGAPLRHFVRLLCGPPPAAPPPPAELCAVAAVLRGLPMVSATSCAWVA